jgi:NADH:ubiquinone oxidoreductase subunit K
MNPGLGHLFWPYSIFTIILSVIGLYCMLASYNLIRVLIGVELLIKAVTLFLIMTGYLAGCTGLMQSMVITLIVIEVVVMTVAVGVVLGIQQRTHSLDVRNIRTLKG